MTEAFEGVALLERVIEKDTKCEFRDPKYNWNCNLEGFQDGDNGLIASLKTHRGIKKPTWPPANGNPSLAECEESIYPSEAHHLIPWKKLKRHHVKRYLKAGSYLREDNGYDVNHGNNGKFMPNATDLLEWKSGSPTRRSQVAELLMGITGVQLHQGRHSKKAYYAGTRGYHEQVQRYLKVINDSCLSHADPKKTACEDCAKGSDGKHPPRRNVVRYVDKASWLLNRDIKLCRIFVSRRAADWAAG